MDPINTVGRRKTSVARVYLTPNGRGRFVINKRSREDYLKSQVLLLKVRRPFDVLGLNPDLFDIKVNVVGGGISGQADAIRLGICRALEQVDPNFRPPLKKEGLLTVDSRQVERKKYGKRKARRSTQFSKR
jgi:small subunit ribosomal protein S9